MVAPHLWDFSCHFCRPKHSTLFGIPTISVYPHPLYVILIIINNVIILLISLSSRILPVTLAIFVKIFRSGLVQCCGFSSRGMVQWLSTRHLLLELRLSNRGSMLRFSTRGLVLRLITRGLVLGLITRVLVLRFITRGLMLGFLTRGLGFITRGLVLRFITRGLVLRFREG